MKFFLFILLSFSFLNANVITLTPKKNIYVNPFNEKFIDKTIRQYKYSLPVYIDDITSLIGIYSPKKNVLILEYILDYEILKTNVAEYNLEMENTDKVIKNIDSYFLSKKVIMDFQKKKFLKHSGKCSMMFKGKNIFSNGLRMIFRYYLNENFYTEFELNNNVCVNIR